MPEGTKQKGELFVHPTEGFHYTLQFETRRTVAMRVETPGNVSVIAPKQLSRKSIEELLKSKSRWIHKQFDLLESCEPLGVQAGLLMFRGNVYPLELKEEKGRKQPELSIKDGKIMLYAPVNCEEACLEQAVEKWYREQARLSIEKKVEDYAGIIGRRPQKVTIKTQKSQWGSCSNRGNLNFNWRLAMAPDSIVDYLVVHELCHLVHLNHSKEYWGLVESVMPDYKERRNWLKQNGIILMKA